MNTHSLNLLLDINEFDEEKICYEKPIMFYKVTRNMGIYYKKKIKSDSNTETKSSKKSNKPNKPNKFNIPTIVKQKIIIQTPKMMVPFGVKEFDNNGKKSYQMSLSFTTLTNLYNEKEIKNFYMFIKKVDNVNEETILEHKKQWNLPTDIKYKPTLKQLSEDYPCHMNVNLPFDHKLGFLFRVYNDKAEKSSIDIIEKRSVVSVILELTDLRFSDTEFRPTWTVMQIRKFKPYSQIQEFFMSECFICDQDEKINPPLKIKPQAKQITYQQQSQVNLLSLLNQPLLQQLLQLGQNNNINNNQDIASKKQTLLIQDSTEKKQSFDPPSQAELLKAKSGLKKTATVEKSIICGKVLDEPVKINPNIPPPPPLPKMNSTISKTVHIKKSLESTSSESESESKSDSGSESESESESGSESESKSESKSESENDTKISKTKSNNNKHIIKTASNAKIPSNHNSDIKSNMNKTPTKRVVKKPISSSSESDSDSSSESETNNPINKNSTNRSNKVSPRHVINNKATKKEVASSESSEDFKSSKRASNQTSSKKPVIKFNNKKPIYKNSSSEKKTILAKTHIKARKSSSSESSSESSCDSSVESSSESSSENIKLSKKPVRVVSKKN